MVWDGSIDPSKRMAEPALRRWLVRRRRRKRGVGQSVNGKRRTYMDVISSMFSSGAPLKESWSQAGEHVFAMVTQRMYTTSVGARCGDCFSRLLRPPRMSMSCFMPLAWERHSVRAGFWSSMLMNIMMLAMDMSLHCVLSLATYWLRQRMAAPRCWYILERFVTTSALSVPAGRL